MSEPTRDVGRCAICGWTMEGEGADCRPGDCSQRPFPDRYYDPERAAREYGPSLPRERNPYIGSPEWKTQQQVAALTAALAEAQRERDEARESAHYADGVAALAMKHRDAAEAEATALREALAQANHAVAYYTGHDLDVLVDRLALESSTGGQPPTGGQ